MARLNPWSRAQWEAHAAEAIVDLVHDRLVVTWAEVEARIAVLGWKDYRSVQPIQLNGALQQLRSESPRRVEEDWTEHDTPVHTLRIPYPPGREY